jgi:hypothetical protein
MPSLTLKPHAQPGLRLYHNHQQQISWSNTALTPGKPLPTLNPTSLATKTEQPRSHRERHHRHRMRTSGTVRPGSSRILLSTSKSCLMTPICWPSTNRVGCPPSPAAASWKTPSCASCKSKPPTRTLFTGWAELLQASSSLPKHRRRPLNYAQTGTHPEFKKSTERWLKTLQSTTPTKFSHPSALYRTRSSVPCGQPTQQANRQSHWQR